MGEVVAVFRKPRKGGPTVPAELIECRRGFGVVDDANAGMESPRQVLLVSHEAETSLGLQPGDLWENVTTAGFDLDGLPSGTVLRLGPSAAIALTEVCEPCKVIKGVTGRSLRELTGRRGMLGVVVADGPVTPGDPVAVLPDRLAALPDSFVDRCRMVVAAIPPGEVLTFDGLISLIGGSKRLQTTLPDWLVAMGNDGLPAHRVIPAPDWVLDREQAARLASEGVAIADGRVSQPPLRRAIEDWLYG